MAFIIQCSWGETQRMPQLRKYQVKDHRIHFKCPECSAKRTLPVPPDLRAKNIRCHRCNSISKAVLNRRILQRQPQSGKAIMILTGGKKLAVHLTDISPDGVGCSIEANATNMISVTDRVHFSCAWNPGLFSENQYTIKNIRGTRVSIQGKTNPPENHFF